jgi:tRNA 2-thiouridine synthesizing protein A
MATKFLDITADSCPMTFVKAKLQLETLGEGQSLEILLKGEEPLENVPRSATESGYSVDSIADNGDGSHTLVISKS